MVKNNKEYPRIVVGAFIFNDKNELFLMETVQWKNYYAVPGGKVEIGETLLEAVKREIKEETNMDISDVKFISCTEGLNLEKSYLRNEKHLIFVNYMARVKDTNNIKLNEEGTKYKWLKLEKWIKKNNINKSTKEILISGALEKNNFENKYKRALADYQNLLKRTAIEKQEFVKFANEQFLYEILPVYDNLKISMDHIDKEAKKSGLAEGIKYIIKQFNSALTNLGVEEIKIKDNKFNPEIMEAIDGKGEKIKKQIKSGYKLKEKVIIPAKVILEN